MDENTYEGSSQQWELPPTGFLRLDRARQRLMWQMDDLQMTANGLSSMAHLIRYADYDTLEGVTEAIERARAAGPL